MIVSPLLARVVGQASRRGLILRVPSGESLLESVETWLLAEYGDSVRSMSRRVIEGGDAELTVALHPAAPELVMSANELRARGADRRDRGRWGPATTASSGVSSSGLASDLSITWDRGEPDPGAILDGLGTTFADRTATERAYLGWLGQTLVKARAGRAAHGPSSRSASRGAPATRSMARSPRSSGRATTAWLDSAVADTRVATDITPWWADATDGQALLNRALALMWLDVRWRAPAIKEERELLDEVHRTLTPGLPDRPDTRLPVAGVGRAHRDARHRRPDVPPGPRPRRSRRRRRHADRLPPAPVTIRHEGWALEIPGSYAERRTPEEWWGGGLGRSITLAAVQTATDGGAMGAQAFVDHVGGDLGPEAIDHRAGGVIGRARLSSDTSSGLEVGVLDGYSAVVGSGAAIRIVFDDPGDWQWALDMWRSLAPG